MTGMLQLRMATNHTLLALPVIRPLFSVAAFNTCKLCFICFHTLNTQYHSRSIYPGDPTTPGYPAYPNVTRTEGDNIPKIPSLPISWANAERLLQELGGTKEGRTLNGKSSDKRIRLVNHGTLWIMVAHV
jgi:hypothetical protein